MSNNKLPLFWWVTRRHEIPQKYTCPFLMTLTVIKGRLRGKNIFWENARYDAEGLVTDSACVIEVNENGIRFQAQCAFSRRWILRECAFWNTRYGSRLRHPQNWKWAD